MQISDSMEDGLCKQGAACAETDFRIYDSVADLPLGNVPAPLSEGIIGVCVGGKAHFDVNANRREVTAYDMVVILPTAVAGMVPGGSDFAMIFIKLPTDLFQETMNGIARITPDFIFYMQRHYAFPLPDKQEAKEFLRFCRMIRSRVGHSTRRFRLETAAMALRLFFFDLFVAYKTREEPALVSGRKGSPKERLVYRYLGLLPEHARQEKQVGFYADKLATSPQYLSMVVKELTGETAREWIAKYTLLRLKNLLRDSDLGIKEIVHRMGFADHSSMSKFFRKRTGMSPTDYRAGFHTA